MSKNTFSIFSKSFPSKYCSPQNAQTIINQIIRELNFEVNREWKFVKMLV